MPTTRLHGKWEETHKRLGQIRHVLGQAVLDFLDADSLMIAGSIAYHSLLAIFPLLLLLLGLTGLYIRRFELSGHLSVVLQRYVPVRADIIMQNLVGISRAYGKIGVVSFLLLLWSSAGVFMPLENALNRAWEVTAQRSWWIKRLVALEMAVIVGCLMLMGAGFVGVEIFFRARLEAWLGQPLHPLVVFLHHVLTAVSSFTLALLMFVVLFERLPNRPMKVRHVLPAALLTALLWETARGLFIILLPHFNYRQVYGSIAVMVAFMTWAYISSVVALFGAQVSHSLYGTLEVTALTNTEDIPAS